MIAQQTRPLDTLQGRIYGEPAGSSIPLNTDTIHIVDGTTVAAYARSAFADFAAAPTKPASDITLGQNVSLIELTDYTAKFGPLTIDLDASAAMNRAGRVVLRSDISITVRTSLRAFMTIQQKAPFPGGPIGDLYRSLGLLQGPIPGLQQAPMFLPLGQDQSSEKSTVASLTLDTPVRPAAFPGSGVIDVTADIANSTPALASSDAGVQRITPAILDDVRRALVSFGSPGGALLLLPRLSLVGALATGAAVGEISISTLDVGVLPAGGQHEPCLWLGVQLTGTAPVVLPPSNFLDGDFAYLCNESVLRALCAYRWRTGDYPTSLASQPQLDSYNDGTTTYAVDIWGRLVQTDVLDGAGTVIAELRPISPAPARQEDFVQLGGHAHFEITVTYADGTVAPKDVQDHYAPPPPTEWLLPPIFLSNVGVPAQNPDPSLDAYFSQLRAGVTRHFSRPFAGTPTVSLRSRNVNGVDRLLLTLADISTL